jgi:hypothetical protein
MNLIIKSKLLLLKSIIIGLIIIQYYNLTALIIKLNKIMVLRIIIIKYTMYILNLS